MPGVDRSARQVVVILPQHDRHRAGQPGAAGPVGLAGAEVGAHRWRQQLAPLGVSRDVGRSAAEPDHLTPDGGIAAQVDGAACLVMWCDPGFACAATSALAAAGSWTALGPALIALGILAGVRMISPPSAH